MNCISCEFLATLWRYNLEVRHLNVYDITSHELAAKIVTE